MTDQERAAHILDELLDAHRPGGVSMTDAIIAVLAVLLFVGLFALVSPYWAWLWGSIATILAFWELVSKLRTGKTLSQRFFAWNPTPMWLKWVVASLPALGGIGLMIHLLWR